MSNLLQYVTSNPDKRVVIVGIRSRAELDELQSLCKVYPMIDVTRYNYFTGRLNLSNGTSVYAVEPNCTGISGDGVAYFNIDVLLLLSGMRETTKQKFLSNLKNRYRKIVKLKRFSR